MRSRRFIFTCIERRKPGCTINYRRQSCPMPETAVGDRFAIAYKTFENGRSRYRLSKTLGWRPPVVRYLGKQGRLNRTPEVMLAYRRAA